MTITNRIGGRQSNIRKSTSRATEQKGPLIDSIPYRIGLELFAWDSDSDILNQAQILCYAHLISGKEKYLEQVY